MSSDIFISYAREDRNRVQPIAEALEQRGYGVWWDKGLRSGEDYRDRIEEMLQTAKCVVVAWSRHSIESDFVIDEAGRGLRRGILLPVFIDEGIEPPLGFGGTHTTDLSGWLDGRDDAALEQFVGDVESRLTPPAPAHAGTSRPPPRPRAAGGGGLRWTALYRCRGARAHPADELAGIPAGGRGVTGRRGGRRIQAGGDVPADDVEWPAPADCVP
jgi:hypothetical protein